MRVLGIGLVAACLLTIPATADEKDEAVARWIRVMGTPEEERPFEAIRALVQIGETSVDPALEVLSDRSEPPYRRWLAAKVLGSLKSKESIPELLEGVKSTGTGPLPHVAAEALGWIGDASVIPALRKIVEATGDARLRNSVERAMAILEGKPPPPRLPSEPRRPTPQKETWKQPEIRTGTPYSDSILWATDVEEALERAKQEGKPVLATVIAVKDRRWCSGYRAAREEWRFEKPPPMGDETTMARDSGLVKERAMMASLFTDPEVVHLVKSHFVPVRIRLHTYHFNSNSRGRSPDPLPKLGTASRDAVSPALVFATADGKRIHVCQRMGVFSVPMARAMLRAVLQKAGNEEVAPFEPATHPDLTKAWRLARAGRLEDALKRVEGRPFEPPVTWEARYLTAHLRDKLGDPSGATDLWRQVAAGDPKGPWGSKAALRLNERGPHLDEWESTHAFPFDPLTETTEVGAGERTLDEVLSDAVSHLLLQQRPDGRWHDPFVDVLPGSGLGSPWDKSVPRTALVVDALVRAKPRLPRRRAEIGEAIDRGIELVGAFADDPRPHVWKLTYALHLQATLLDRKAGRPKVAKRRAKRLLRELAVIQQEGGWSYMSAPRVHSFNTAPVLLLMANLREYGVEAPKGMAAKAAEFLESCRVEGEPLNFLYSKTMPFPAQASSCRTALCELALLEHAGKRDAGRVRRAIDFMFVHDDGVRETTKVFEDYFAPGSLQDSYHYYFGHYYAALALAHLPESEARRYAARQSALILSQREVDGSFVDSQIQGKCTSTAFAMLTLLEGARYRD